MEISLEEEEDDSVIGGKKKKSEKKDDVTACNREGEKRIIVGEYANQGLTPRKGNPIRHESRRFGGGVMKRRVKRVKRVRDHEGWVR